MMLQWNVSEPKLVCCVLQGPYDVVLLPGGGPGAQNLSEVSRYICSTPLSSPASRLYLQRSFQTTGHLGEPYHSHSTFSLLSHLLCLFWRIFTVLPFHFFSPCVSPSSSDFLSLLMCFSLTLSFFHQLSTSSSPSLCFTAVLLSPSISRSLGLCLSLALCLSLYLSCVSWLHQLLVQLLLSLQWGLCQASPPTINVPNDLCL